MSTLPCFTCMTLPYHSALPSSKPVTQPHNHTVSICLRCFVRQKILEGLQISLSTILDLISPLSLNQWVLYPNIVYPFDRVPSEAVQPNCRIRKVHVDDVTTSCEEKCKQRDFLFWAEIGTWSWVLRAVPRLKRRSFRFGRQGSGLANCNLVLFES